jgi:antirestriction protein ArdC
VSQESPEFSVADSGECQLKLKQAINSDRPVVDLDKFIETQGVEIIHGGDRAYYSSIKDEIHLPKFECFTSATAYYSTVMHELAHATGHSSRLNRPLGNDFGSPEYAFEELIAEIAACMVCQDLGIKYQLENHASYLKGWIACLKDDKTAFVRAFSKAQMASCPINLIHSYP